MQELLLIAFCGFMAAVAFFVSLNPNRSKRTRAIATLLTRRDWAMWGYTKRAQLLVVTLVFSLAAGVGLFMLLS